MKKILAFILPFFVFTEIFSQNDKVLRVEIPVVENTLPFSVINFQEKGLLVHSKNSFYFFNKYLTNVWKQKITLPDNMAVSGSNIIGGNIYLVACNTANTNTNNRILLMGFGINTGEVKIDTLPNPAKEAMVKSFVRHSTLWNIHRGNSNLHIVIYDFATMEYSEYQLNKFSKQDILDIQLDTSKNLLHILYADEKRSDGNLTLLTLKSNAEVLQNITTKFDNLVVVDGKIVLNNGEIMLVGTYNTESKNIGRSIYDNVMESSGFFSAKIEYQNIHVISQLNYTDFNNFLTDVGPDGKNRYDRMRRVKGEQSMDNLVLFGWVPHKGNVFVSAEAFERRTTTQSKAYYDYYGRVMPVSNIVFEGYAYNDIYCAEIDAAGNFVFSKVIDISSAFLSENLDKTTSILPDDTPMLLMANDKNISYFDMFSDKKFSILSLQTLYKSDIIKDSYNMGIDYWYGNYMFAFGYQTIQNKQSKQSKGSSKRSVFYLTKLVME
ncbi:hypothetical protein FACS1894180_2100 [Bacteroidia bacterium]|nr:hypothetical protein FACS1894178_8070 [Bacteroidia bacterium]GHV43336.1 hypothetical protein FACS1894180_2100 [Bacteroidia bacterium]